MKKRKAMNEVINMMRDLCNHELALRFAIQRVLDIFQEELEDVIK